MNPHDCGCCAEALSGISNTLTTIPDKRLFGEYRAADLAIETELTSDYSTICDHMRQNGHGF
jgi:hypothetical protein